MLKKCFYQVTVYLTVISLLAGILMTAGMPVPADAADALWAGSGTPDDPYLIASADDLVALSDPDYKGYWGACFRQTADINLTGVAWKPVGTYSSPFTGSYDGNGHTISNLTINHSNDDGVGFIGFISGRGIVSNLHIEDAQVTGKVNVGILAGIIAESGIVNEGGTIENCSVAGTVTGQSRVGGLIGSVQHVNAVVRKSFSLASVSANRNDSQYSGVAGGLAGFIYYGTVEDCYSNSSVTDGNLTGGFAGEMRAGTVQRCYSISSVSGNWNQGFLSSKSGGTVSSSFFSSATGLTDSYAASRTLEELKQQTTFSDWDFSTVWKIGEGVSCPTLRWQPWTPDERITAGWNALTWDAIKGANTTQDNVLANLILPTTGAMETTISWIIEPDDGTVDLSTGEVTRDENEDKNVTLTATVSYDGGTSRTQVFALTVKKLIPDYTVTYNANGGTGAGPSAMQIAEDATFTVAENTFTPPEGRQFKEWNTRADGTGTGYSPGATVTMPSEDLTLFAIWVALEVSSAATLEISLDAGNRVVGVPFNLTVEAKDAGGNTVTDYNGNVTFSSTDPSAVLPASYTFTPSDGGIHTFQMTFNTSGFQTLTVSDMPAGLAGYWKFDEGSGTIIGESTGRGSSGTLYSYGSVWGPGAPGILFPNPSALALDGNNWAEIGGVDLAGRSFSLSFWGKRTRLSTQEWILSQGNQQAKDQLLHVGFQNNNDFAFAFYSDDLLVPSTSYTSDTEWHHWALTYDAGTRERKIYQDGELILSDTAEGDLNSSGVLVLGKRTDVGQPFQGGLDDLRIYSAVLSQSEISALAGGVTGWAEESSVVIPVVTESGRFFLSYDANGGSGPAPAISELLAGGEFTVAAASTFTAPVGKLFKAWNTATDGSGSSYTPGETAIMPAANLVLYAIWEEIVWQGDGTENNPYLVSSAEHLHAVRYKMGGGVYFRQTADIALTDINWTPIGDHDNPFEGVYDGNHKKITHLAIDSDSMNYVGLFGYICEGGQLKNVILENASVTSTLAQGYNIYVGGLVGYNYGTITNCTISGTVSVSGEYGSDTGGLVGCNYGTITNCTISGTVSVSGGDSSETGGLVGFNNYYGNIVNCYSTGTVSGGNSSKTGGLVGFNNNYGNIVNCYSTGTVSGGNSSKTGGLVGDVNTGNITSSYYDMTLNPGMYDYDYGRSTEDMKTAITFTGWNFAFIWEIDEGESYPTLQPPPELDGSGTEADPFQVSSAAHLNAVRYYFGPGVYFQQTADINLAGINWLPIGDYSNSFDGVYDGNNKKITNLTINSNFLDPVGLFGCVDEEGQLKNVILEDVSVTSTLGDGEYVGGLAGDNYGSIEYCSISGIVDGGYWSYIGGLVGDNDGTIEKCLSTSSVNGGEEASVGGLVGENYGSIVNSSSFGTVNGDYDSDTGGLVGYNYGSIVNCSSSSDVSGGRWSYTGGLVGYNYYGNIVNCYSFGAVNGRYGSDAGGLVGCNYGSIEKCFSTSSVNGGEDDAVGGLVGHNYGDIVNCYSTGNVSVSGGDESYAGGLVGENYHGSIVNSYSTGQVTGEAGASIGGLVGYDDTGDITFSYYDMTLNPGMDDEDYGLDTEDMQTAITFTDNGWDFTNTWRINEGVSYPRLRWQPYQITVLPPVNGTAGDSSLCPEGQILTLWAIPEAGYNFSGWYAGDTLLSALPNYTFTVDADLILEARFVEMPDKPLQLTVVGSGRIELSGDASATITGAYTHNFPQNSSLTLTATPNEGYAFSHWAIINTSTITSLVSTNPVYTCILGEGIHLMAVFRPLSNTSGPFSVIFKDKSGRILQETEADKDAEVSPPSTPSLVGYTFNKWDPEDYKSVTSDLIINAVYTRLSDTYTVTVEEGGTLAGGETSGEFLYDTPVTVVAGDPPEGQKFSHWEQDGLKVSLDSTFTFFAPMYPTTLKAVFMDENAFLDDTPFIVLKGDVVVDTANLSLLFTAQRYVGSDYTLVESGVLLLESSTVPGELTLATPGVIRGRVKAGSTDQFYIRKINVSDGATWYGRAYLIYQDAAGNIVTVYSSQTLHATMSAGG